MQADSSKDGLAPQIECEKRRPALRAGSVLIGQVTRVHIFFLVTPGLVEVAVLKQIPRDEARWGI